MNSKAKNSATRGVVQRLFRPLDGRAWPTAAGIFFVCMIGLTTYHLWKQYGSRVMAQPRYQLDPSRIKITPQPDYISSDVLASAIVHGGLRNLNLLQKDVVLQVKQSFEVQPWVKEVVQANKKYPSTIEVELNYRRPMAMIEVPAGMFPSYDYEGLLPIDEEAYLLPVEMTPEQANELPKIAGIDSSPAGAPGSPWGDTRVAEAVEIVALLEDIWGSLDLRKVEVPPRPEFPDQRASSDFVLVTRGYNKFTWGSAPGKEATGEESAKQKAAELKEFTQQFGSLDEWKETHHHPAEATVGAVIQWNKRR